MAINPVANSVFRLPDIDRDTIQVAECIDPDRICERFDGILPKLEICSQTASQPCFFSERSLRRVLDSGFDDLNQWLKKITG